MSLPFPPVHIRLHFDGTSFPPKCERNNWMSPQLFDILFYLAWEESTFSKREEWLLKGAIRPTRTLRHLLINVFSEVRITDYLQHLAAEYTLQSKTKNWRKTIISSFQKISSHHFLNYAKFQRVNATTLIMWSAAERGSSHYELVLDHFCIKDFFYILHPLCNTQKHPLLFHLQKTLAHSLPAHGKAKEQFHKATIFKTMRDEPSRC